MSGKQRLKAGDKNVMGANIRRIRLDRGFSQTEFSKLISEEGVTITREGLVKIEGGRQHISLDQLKAIRDMLCCTYDDLLCEH